MQRATLPHLSYEFHETLRQLQINGIFCNFIQKDWDDGTGASEENGFSFFNLIALLFCQSLSVKEESLQVFAIPIDTRPHIHFQENELSSLKDADKQH